MIAPAKPKRKKASERGIANDATAARRGGEVRRDAESLTAAKINRLDGLPSADAISDVEPAADASASDNESVRVSRKHNLSADVTANECLCAEPAADGPCRDSERSNVSRKNKRGEGEHENATEAGFAAPRKTRQTVPRLSSGSLVSGSGGGDEVIANDLTGASRRKNKGRSKVQLKPNGILSDQGGSGGGSPPDSGHAGASICRQLQELQRRKAATLKSRIMIDNQLAALVSTELGYHAGMEEKERKGLRAKAEQLIKAIDAGDETRPELEAVRSRVASIVQSTHIARNGFDHFLSGIEKEMIALAKQLPAAKWIEDADRRGFGILSLATVIGETGDLSLYANPAKVWKRLGLAPYQGKMPSTWRKQGGLSAEQWTEIGYSPRRRSVMFVIGENIVKQNKGTYRKRYDESKVTAHANHEDWSDGRCHWHAMLLATKRLVRDLWKSWNSK